MHVLQTRLSLERVEVDPAHISFVLGAPRPVGSVLEVGVGAGQFVDA